MASASSPRGPVLVHQRVIPLNSDGTPVDGTKLVGAGADSHRGDSYDDDDVPSTETAATAAAATQYPHYYYAAEGVITMPAVANVPPPPSNDATPEQIEQYNRQLVVARRQQALEEHLDLIYRFVSWVATDLGQGYTPEQFWKGEASGRGALHLLLSKATQHWMDHSSLLEPNARHGEFHNVSALKEAANTRYAHTATATSTAASGSAAAASSPATYDQSKATSAKMNAQERLSYMLSNASQPNGVAITEPMLRAYDMLYYHNGEYIPPNGHAVQTPREEIELALKFAQLERFFEARNDGDAEGGAADLSGAFGHSVKVDGRVVHEVFLEPPMQKGIVDATTFVHNVCRRPHIAQIDLMTHQRVCGNFSHLVASMINRPSELNPRRPMQALTMRSIARNHNDLKKFFENVDYVEEGRDRNGTRLRFLADMRVYDAAGEASRRATESERARYMERHGTYYSDATVGATTKPYRASYQLTSDTARLTSSSSSGGVPAPAVVMAASVVAAPESMALAMLAARQHIASTTTTAGGGSGRPASRGGSLASARPAVTPTNISLHVGNPHVVTAAATAASVMSPSKRPSDTQLAEHESARMRMASPSADTTVRRLTPRRQGHVRFASDD